MNAVSETTERVALYYREGSSDKVYQAAIEPAGQQFVVKFAYGRRGATLTTGTKTSSPVDYATAKKIYTKLVREKKAKGYTEGADGTPYQHTDKQASGILPQLLNPIEESEVELLLCDDNYCAQEKFDGRHLLVRKQDEHLEGINKKGLLVGLPQTVADDFRQFPGSFIPDGESIGDDYHVFDLLELNGENLRPLPYRARLTSLMNLLASAQQRHVHYVETAFTTRQKTELWQRLRRENREGIVFKRLDAFCNPAGQFHTYPICFPMIHTACAFATTAFALRTLWRYFRYEASFDRILKLYTPLSGSTGRRNRHWRLAGGRLDGHRQIRQTFGQPELLFFRQLAGAGGMQRHKVDCRRRANQVADAKFIRGFRLVFEVFEHHLGFIILGLGTRQATGAPVQRVGALFVRP